ncbi:MAG: HlyD family type I secretion periplasmic adaptor subunit [gamma proteobacterium symbiont of Taylorina sp.]|nr:HlyD family type I secretion periplasmic adaptor subunit [gamma proteobacterium symbiont of Taylorina sp.]
MSNEIIEQIGKPDVNNWILAGFAVLLFFLLVLVGWAGFTTIDAATITQGSITIKDKHKKIQHLEGGIASEIYVKEHSEVKKGQILMTLNQTKARALLDLVTNQYLTALALEARLMAEKKAQSNIKWPETLDQNHPQAQVAMEEQEGIFVERLTTHTGQIKLLENKVRQTKKAFGGTKKQYNSLNKQYRLILREVENARILTRKKLATKQKLMGLEREALQIDERLRSLETHISTYQYEIDDGNLKISNLKNKHHNEIVELQHKARLNLSDLTQKLKAAQDVLERTKIIAPQKGIVINLAITTLRSVIKPGETIMEIVPTDATYIIETRIDPKDIDVVKKGAKTQIRLTSYKQRITPTLYGTVLHVSADTLFDKKTGDKYYSVIIEIDSISLKKYPGINLYPGMPADVMIISDSRTVIQYLFQPVFESFNQAFREK